MVAIEFLDPDEPAPGLDTAAGEEIGRDPARGSAFDAGVLAPFVLLAGAAALALVAPFQQLFVIRQRGAGDSLTFAADGWGRVVLNAAPGQPAGFHFSRFGIPLVICAGLLAVAALVVLGTAVGAPVSDRMLAVGAGALLAVTGVLIGVVAAMWLLVDAQFDSLRTGTVDVEAGPTTPTGQYGPGLWLVSAAVLAAALGLAAARRRHQDR